MVVLALMAAIGALLSFIEIPTGTFLKYDASAMPAMVCGLAYGPAAGIVVGVIGSVIHGIYFADWGGAVMNIIVIVGIVLPSALIYKKMHTFKGALVALTVGVLCSVVAAIAGNFLVTSIYYGVDAVIALLPVLLAFNFVKAIVNSVLTLIVYKSISNLITPKKKQIKGRKA